MGDFSLSQARSNLQVLVQQQPTKKNTAPNIVVFRNQLWSTSTAFGRLWKMISQLMEFLKIDGAHIDKIKHVWKSTTATINHHPQNIKKEFDKYVHYCRDILSETAVNERGLGESRRIITEWNDFYRQLNTTSFQDQLNTALGTLASNLGGISPKNLGLSNILQDSKLKQISECQEMLDLEGLLHSPLPLDCLEKLSRGQKLSPNQNKKLNLWIERANSANRSVRKFHNGLKATVALFNHQFSRFSSVPARLDRLEWELVKRKCQVFEQEDDDYTLMRSTLGPNDKVFCNGKKYILSSLIGHSKAKNDQHRVFALQGQNDKVLIVGKNEAHLGIESMRIAEENWDIIPSVTYHDVDPIKGFAIVEKLQMPLDSIQWTSSQMPINPQDQQNLLPTIKLIVDLLAKGTTPEHFSRNNFTQYLLYDTHQKTLKTTRLCKQGKYFDFHSLVLFAAKVSKDNPFVFSSLMTQSGLSNHRYSTFYLNVIDRALKGEKVDLPIAAGAVNITDPQIVKNAKKVIKKINKLLTSCQDRIITHYNIGSSLQESYRIEIQNTFLSYYKALGSSGYLWKQLEEMIVSEIVKNKHLKART